MIVHPIDIQLQNLNLTLPQPAASVASYVPFVIIDKLVFISGQLPMENGAIKYTGQVTMDNIETGKLAAHLCALNILAQLKAACENDWHRVSQCVRLGGFVNCGADFHQHPQVINGASDLFTQVLGESSRHARAAVGSSSLPFNAMVEVDAIFKLIY